jgi:uncharacterized membrane protein YbhN (UPF0104 family)
MNQEPLTDPAAVAPPRWRAIVTRTGASAVIGVSLYFILRELGVEFVPSAASLAKLDRPMVALFGLLWLVGTFFRVYRWVHLLRPIEPDVAPMRTFGIGLVGFAAIFAPLRMGEVARPLLVARDGKISFIQALGTVAAERIVDGLMLTSIAVLGLWVAPPVSPLPKGLGSTTLPLFLVVPSTRGALFAFLSLAIAMAVFYFWRTTAHRIVFRMVALASKPLATMVTSQVERISDSLQFLISRRHGLRFLRDTSGYWLTTVLAIMVMLQAAGIQATFWQACLIIGVMALSTTLPGPPGFLGTFQFGAYCGIALYFPTQAEAAARFTFISYCAQLTNALLCLLVGLWIVSRHAAAATQPVRGMGAAATAQQIAPSTKK